MYNLESSINLNTTNSGVKEEHGDNIQTPRSKALQHDVGKPF